MDNIFEQAFNEFGIKLDDMKSIPKQVEGEIEDARRQAEKNGGIPSEISDITLNRNQRTIMEPGTPFHVLSGAERDQAVRERIVPQSYRDATFNIEKIKENIRAQYKLNKMYKVYKFNDYANVCNNILCTIRMKQLPDMSYIIGAPNGFGKTSFVTECLMTLRAHGYKVAPYISLWELAQIRVDNEHRIMNPYRKFIKEDDQVVYYEQNSSDLYIKKPQIVTNGYSYSEYINADCLFVSFTDIISKDIESHTLYQLLSIRGAKGLPTIVTISTSLEPYENDRALKEYVWDEIRNYNENRKSFDRVYHVSCYKRKDLNLNNQGQNIDSDTGIVS